MNCFTCKHGKTDQNKNLTRNCTEGSVDGYRHSQNRCDMKHIHSKDNTCWEVSPGSSYKSVETRVLSVQLACLTYILPTQYS